MTLMKRPLTPLLAAGYGAAGAAAAASWAAGAPLWVAGLILWMGGAVAVLVIGGAVAARQARSTSVAEVYDPVETDDVDADLRRWDEDLHGDAGRAASARRAS